MIISRTPLRITLGGGGTDLPSFYTKYGGFLISGAINKHVYVGVNRQFYNTYSLKYSKVEMKESIDQIEHNLIREALRLLDIPPGIEVTSLADIPSGTGLGSSGAFLVSLLNSLHLYKGKNSNSKRQLAEEACKIELDILKEHEGKQDKYACAFGGIKAYEFNKNGSVSVIPLVNEDMVISELKNNLLFFFTGIKRQGKASDALKNQDIKTKEDDSDMLRNLLEIKNIGLRTKKAFEDLDFDTFGYLLNDHWKIKKKYSPSSTNDFIDGCYQTALDNGALGGKIMGAGGGGGFFMFYHPGTDKEKWSFIDVMKQKGLKQMDYSFDNEGVCTIAQEE